MIVILDTGVISLLVTDPGDPEEAERCSRWLLQILVRGARVAIPEVCDYEVRRGLLLAALKT